MSENTVKTYQCPACGAPLHFDSSLQKMKCDNCENTYTIEEIGRQLNEEKEPVPVEEQVNLHWSGEEESHLKSYTCPACGARLISDDTTVAASCPYCGNHEVVAERAEGALRPDYLIPFHKSKEDACAVLKQFYKGKPFLPANFRTENHIQEIKGIYVPFWLFDAEASCNLQYQAERVHTRTNGDDIITITDHYAVGRQSKLAYRQIPADASASMPDALMDSIEPFDYGKLKEFNLSYLAGYMADRYDIDADSDMPRIEKRIRDTAVNKTRGTILGYTAMVPLNENVSVNHISVHYAFLPVWLLTTKYRGKNYLFAMNGESGRMAADPLPVSRLRFFLTFMILAGIGILILLFVL